MKKILLFLVLAITSSFAIAACGTLAAGLNTLTVDVTTTTTCFTYVANSILDCAGHSVTGNLGTSVGLLSSVKNNITALNCRLLNLSTGIKFTGTTTGFTINNTNITTTSSNAIILNAGAVTQGSINNIVISDVRGTNNGFFMDGGSDANIAFNNIMIKNINGTCAYSAGATDFTFTQFTCTNLTGGSSGNGIYTDHGTRVTIQNSNITNVSGTAIKFNDFGGAGINNVAQNSIISGAAVGLEINDNNKTTLTNLNITNAAIGLKVTNPSAPPQTYTATGIVFDNPNGGLANFTNLSITDSYASESYTVTWNATPTIFPDSKKMDVAHSWINLTTLSGSPSLDTVTWQYRGSDIVNNMLENDLAIFKTTGGAAWSKLTTTLNTTAKTLVLTSLPPSGVYGPMTQNLSITPILPSDNAVVTTAQTVLLQYQTNNQYAIACNMTFDSSLASIDNQSLASSTLVNVTTSPTNGGHTWFLFCYDAADPSYNLTSATFHFTAVIVSIQNTITLSNASENVISPQRLFYDAAGNLYALYFVNSPPLDNLSIHKIQNNSVNQNLTIGLNATKDFYVALREPTNLTLLTFNKDNATMDFIELNGGIHAPSFATALNVVNNTFFDPYAYANTQQFQNLTFISGSFYLFWVPTTTDSRLMKVNVNSYTLTQLNVSNHNRAIVWQSIAKDQNLSTWYFAAPFNTSCTSTTDQIGIFSYDGTTQTLIDNIDGQCYNQTDLESTKVFFEQYGGVTYAMDMDPNDSHIMNVNTDIKVKLNTSLITNPSNFLFIDNSSFVFFDTTNGTITAYSCYFNSTAGNCVSTSQSNYGALTPFSRGAMATNFRNGTGDVLTSGTIFKNTNVNTTQLTYSTDVYDTKFICYDEILEYRKLFTVQIFTNITGTVLQTPLWGYVIPSTSLGPGQKNVYSLCNQGSNRLYLLGLTSNFRMDFYSLNLTQGAFYTFVVKDQFGRLIQNATITATRFSILKQAFVTIEQGVTDYTGSAVLFLQQFNLYKFTITEPGFVPINFDFVPGTSGTIQVALNQNGSQSLVFPKNEYLWNDTKINISPQTSFSTSDANLSFQVASSGNNVQYFGMKITKYFNGTGTVVYSNNVTGSPSGGTVVYTTNGSGNYYMDIFFKDQNFSEYQGMTKIYSVATNSSFGNAQAAFQSDQPISPWAFYLIGVVIAMLAGGFASKYVVDGAGIIAALVLSLFTIFEPFSQLVCIAGISGLCITPVVVTSVVWIAVIAVLYITRYY